MCVCFTPSPMEVAENTWRICFVFILQDVSTGLIRSVDHISWILVGAMGVINSKPQLDPLTVAAHTSAHCPALVTRMTRHIPRVSDEKSALSVCVRARPVHFTFCALEGWAMTANEMVLQECPYFFATHHAEAQAKACNIVVLILSVRSPASPP